MVTMHKLIILEVLPGLKNGLEHLEMLVDLQNIFNAIDFPAVLINIGLDSFYIFEGKTLS